MKGLTIIFVAMVMAMARTRHTSLYYKEKYLLYLFYLLICQNGS